MQCFRYQRKHNANIDKSKPFKMKVLVNDFFFTKKYQTGATTNKDI